MIAVRGAGSAIVTSLRRILPKGEVVVAVGRGEPAPLDANRYLFCQGLIRAKRASEQTEAEIAETLRVNAFEVINEVDRIITDNDQARICVIGSESGFSGSFDDIYARAKAFLHQYVETKRLRTPKQQLICVAPTIIADSGMTLARHDLEDVKRRGADHPKGRWLTCFEVAHLIHYVLYVDRGYLSGVVIRMNGGAHCR